MTDTRYPVETFDDDDYPEDDGTMPANVEALAEAVVGHRIVSAESVDDPGVDKYWSSYGPSLVLTLDNGKRVVLRNTSDCCAYTELQEFFLDPAAVDHMILGVGTTEGYTTWHIYADFGDVMKMKVGWSCGNPFYYGYGFDIEVEDVGADEAL